MADDKGNLANILGIDSGSDNGAAAEKRSGESAKRERNLDLILDIPLRVTVELGRTKMIVARALREARRFLIEFVREGLQTVI